MRKPVPGRVHAPGLLKRLVEELRGREQRLVRGPEKWPLLLLSFPRGSQEVVDDLEGAWLHMLPWLRTELAGPYRRMMERLPAIVVVMMQPRNVCSCLGHHHPRGTETRMTRRLAGETGGEVGEIDLAWEAIRAWRPHPLTTLGAESSEDFASVHFRTALLTVLVHELEHLAYPERGERQVRGASDDFYGAALEELLGVPP